MIRENGTAVITGAGSGIGRGLAVQLARQHGMNVVLAGRRKQRLDELAVSLREYGVAALPLPCDVGKRDDVLRLKEQALAKFGSVDLLCLNAGTATAGLLVEHTAEEWDRTYNVVLMGVAYGIQAFLPVMIRTGAGHILITASISGLVPDAFVNHGPYVSAKAAVIGMGVALKEELRSHGIGVSVLIPAASSTDMVSTSSYNPSSASNGQSYDFSVVRPRPGLPDMVPDSEVFLDPEEVARRAIAGVERDMTFIATHPGHLPMVEEYCARMVEAFKQDWPALLTRQPRPEPSSLT